jgi:putative effector of murein hydrolase
MRIALTVLFVLVATVIGAVLGMAFTQFWYARQSFSSGEAVMAASYAVIFLGGPVGAILGFITGLVTTLVWRSRRRLSNTQEEEQQ